MFLENITFSLLTNRFSFEVLWIVKLLFFRRYIRFLKNLETFGLILCLRRWTIPSLDPHAKNWLLFRHSLCDQVSLYGQRGVDCLGKHIVLIQSVNTLYYCPHLTKKTLHQNFMVLRSILVSSGYASSYFISVPLDWMRLETIQT